MYLVFLSFLLDPNQIHIQLTVNPNTTIHEGADWKNMNDDMATPNSPVKSQHKGHASLISNTFPFGLKKGLLLIALLSNSQSLCHGGLRRA